MSYIIIIDGIAIVIAMLLTIMTTGRESTFLGSGAFGTVHRGVWCHSGSGSGQVDMVEEEVAVKSMESGASEEERVKFLQEAAIMGQFNHPNIVRIMGILIDQNEV